MHPSRFSPPQAEYPSNSPAACRHREPSRRTIVARFALFALLLLVPLGAGEAYVRSLPNPSKSKHAYLRAHSREVEVLVLGSSHTYYGVCPETLSPHAYSAAQVSQTLRYDDYLLHHYPFPRLRRVVVPVSDFSLYEELEGGREWYLASRYRLYMDCDLHSRWSVYGWEMTAFRVFCEKLQRLWKPAQMRWSRYGQGLEYTVENKREDWDYGEERAATNRYTAFGHAPDNVAHLQHMADFCRQQGAELLLLSTPLRPTYRAHQNPLQVADTDRRVAEFLRRNPQVRYLDFRRDARFTADDFYDTDHLSLTGARKLSALIRATWDGTDRE